LLPINNFFTFTTAKSAAKFAKKAIRILSKKVAASKYNRGNIQDRKKISVFICG